MRTAVIAVLAAALVACSSDAPAPGIEAITPARVTSLVPTPAQVTGRELYRAVHVALDDGTAEIEGDWGVAIDGVAIAGAHRIDDHAVELLVPAGLALGAHDVSLTGPRGELLTLPGALIVTDDPIGLPLLIEDAPGGSGAPVPAQAMRAGDELTVHAVLRTPAGEYVADVDATWSITNAVGAVTPVPPGAASLQARVAGAGELAATYRSAIPAPPVAITVTAGDAVALSVESQPGGAGVPVPAQALTTDATLAVHAVLRDAFANFVADTTASWAVTGGIGVVSAGGVLDPRTVGVGQITATAGALTGASGDLTIGAGVAATLVVVPDTLTLSADAAPAGFTATATDADGNSTSDLGTLSWATTGPITAIGPTTGVLDPTAAGTGAVTVASSHGAGASSGAVTITAGAAAALVVAPDTLTLSADAPVVPFTATATDADGNPTSDLGTLTWTTTGPITAIDATTGLLDPRAAGLGGVTATSSTGAADSTGAITITPGVAAVLAVAPPTLAVTADDAAVGFTATATDADGNPTSDLGTLTWATTGPITEIDPASGALDPRRAGAGTVTAASSYGVTGASGTVTITPGRAVSLALSPPSATVSIGASLALTVDGLDADTNPTTDLGTLIWSVTGGIGDIDGSGTLTTTAAGTGAVDVVSSYGPTGTADPITVIAFDIIGIALPATVSRGQHDVRIELEVENPGSTPLPLIAAWLAPSQAGIDRSADYVIEGDWRNPDVLPAGGSATLILWVTVGSSAALGAIDVLASVQTFLAGAEATATELATWTVDAGPAPVARITPPPDRVCRATNQSYYGTGSSGGPLTYGWDLDGASPGTSTAASPTVQYSAIGAFTYALTVTSTATGRDDTARAAVLTHVGEPSVGEDYPTGALRVIKTGSLVVELDNLPDASVFDDSKNIQACDGDDVDAGFRYVTVWIDRGVIPSSADQRLDVPGIQRLVQSDDKPALTMLHPDPIAVEGPGLAYEEFFHPGAGVVTASGRDSITMIDDQVAPTVTAAAPFASPGCSAAICTGKDQILRFTLGEPLAPTTVTTASVVVERGPDGSSCGDATAFAATPAAISYDPSAWTVTVAPVAQAGTQYKLRARLTSAIRDTAASPNSLAPYTVCVTAGDRVTPPAPAPTAVAASPATFSPDFDGTADTTTFTATVGADVIALEIVLSRGPNKLVTLTQVTPGPGSYGVVWDGRDATGRLLRDGPVLYTVRAVNALGAASTDPVHGVVTVDSAIHFVGVPR